jgi:hypothetical protein
MLRYSKLGPYSEGRVVVSTWCVQSCRRRLAHRSLACGVEAERDQHSTFRLGVRGQTHHHVIHNALEKNKITFKNNQVLLFIFVEAVPNLNLEHVGRFK